MDERRDAVVFACDAGHLDYAHVAATRVADLHPARTFDVLVCTPDMGAVPAARRGGAVAYRRLDVSGLPDIVPPKRRITRASFYRLLLPDQLARDYRAILYLDTDTYLARPGIDGLFARLPEGFALAGAPDFVHEIGLKGPKARRRRRSAALMRDLAGASGRYVQSGVLVMRTAECTARRIGPRVLEWAAAHPEMLARHRMADQAAINGACGGEIAALDPRWNWHGDRWLRPRHVEAFQPYVLHFTGTNKPWLHQDDPYVAAWNAPWFAALAAIGAPAPGAAAGSVPWLADRPRFGVPPLDAAHRAWRRRRAARRHARERVPPEGLAHMRGLIDAAAVG